jgi:hypothetical protein
MPAASLVPDQSGPSLKDHALLLLVTLAAMLVQGYHPFVEDAEIYVPGILKALHPELYPYNAAFFTSHAHLTFFPNLIAASVRLTHLPLAWALLFWQIACIYLLLVACWHFGRIAFRDPRARWGGVALVASLLTLPVAGTALYIMDQYLNTRSLSTPAVLFIILNVIERKFVRALLWCVACALIHPLMVGFGAAFAVLFLWTDRKRSHPDVRYASAAILLPFGFFPPVTGAYRDVLATRSYFFLLQWQWYEWLGIFAPIAIFLWFERIARKQDLPILRSLCRTLILFTLIFLGAALIITIPSALIRFAELQPMRSLHLVYILMLVIGGGLLAQFWLKSHTWRWLVLFVPLCAGMFFAQRQTFPATAHLELPFVQSNNPWVQTFVWIRENTPVKAYFALNPDHMDLPGEDQHGFRAIAERSMLADRRKDSGAVTMFPALAETWLQQVEAQKGWDRFQAADFRDLEQNFGINWVVLDRSPLPGMNCPYHNGSLSVCRLE